MRKIALGVSSVVCLAVVLVLACGSISRRGMHVRSAANGPGGKRASSNYSEQVFLAPA